MKKKIKVKKPLAVRASPDMFRNAECQDAELDVDSSVAGSNELPGCRSGTASPPQPTRTTVATRSHNSVPPSPSRLPYLAVCGVGVLVIILGVCVTVYKLHAAQAVIALFNQSTALRRPAEFDSGRHLRKNARKVFLTEWSCRTDECVWARDYLAGKINWSVNPCVDFYAYVCSGRWSTPDRDVQSRAYRERAAGMMMMDVEKFFRNYLKENEQQYHMYPGVFLHQAISFLPKCQSEEKDDENLTSLRSLLEEYNLGDWPYDKSPANASITTVLGFVDRDLGVFPFARVYLRRLFEDDRSYIVHIDAPSLTMKRFNLAYLNDPPEDFSRKVVLALTLFDSSRNMTEEASAIALLENKLFGGIGGPRFVEFHERMKRVGQLDKDGKWAWKEYLTVLFQDIQTFDDDKTVAVMKPDYVKKLGSILNETDTVTLLNYVGYRMVVHLSPLLPKAASSLLRLSYDSHLEFVSDRLQACMHMLERVYKHGMRFFGRMTFSKRNSTLLLRHYDRSMSSIEVQLKSAMTDRLLSSSSWLERSAIGVGVDKLENLRLVFLGSTDDINTIADYYNFNSRPLDPANLVESFRELQAGTMKTYWESKPPERDLDARYDHTALSPGHEYFFGRNVLFVPHSNIAFLNDVTKSIEPILFPLVVGEILRGMFEAVDRRGSAVNHNLAVSKWWNPDEMSKFSQLELCFQDQYSAEARNLIGDNFEARVRLEDNIADNAVLAPLFDVYTKALSIQDGADRLRLSVEDRKVDMQQLFFILYAVELCDNPSRESWVRKLKFGEVPGRLRVNIPLMNFAKFSAAFSCPLGMPMNPARKCIVW